MRERVGVAICNGLNGNRRELIGREHIIMVGMKDCLGLEKCRITICTFSGAVNFSHNNILNE